MQEKYRHAIRRLPRAARVAVIEELELECAPRQLDQHLEDCGLSSADVVLVLLRRGGREMRQAAEKVAGVAIQRLLTGMPPAPRPPARATRSGDERRVTRVATENPRLSGTPSWHRFRLIRKGRSVAELLGRGVTRRDLREALKGGWVELEDEE